MGLLVNGQWVDQWYETEKTGGRFVRQQSHYHNRVKATENSIYPAQPDRYHIYASLACPWAHRVLIFRKLKKLEDVISLSLVEPLMLEKGWTFGKKYPDHLYGKSCLYQIYTKDNPTYSGRVTVPVLWDRKTESIVNNESSEILRMLNSEFQAFSDEQYDYYPQNLRSEIDEINDFVYERVNNGVYKAGFATTQEAYNEAVTVLFNALDDLEKRLQRHSFLVGNRLTEADIRLFTTLVRFDSVYFGHFKCNIRRLVDYPNLHSLAKRIYDIPGVSETVDLEYTKTHYYGSHRTINPTGIIPRGPAQW